MNVYRLGTAAVIALGLVSSGFAATTAQDASSSFPAQIVAGSCDSFDQAGEPAYQLADAAYALPSATGESGTSGAGPVGPAEAVPVATSVTDLDASLSDLVDQPHALVALDGAATGTTNAVACGAIGGAYNGQDLLFGLQEQNDSGYTGVGWVTTRGDSGVTVTLFLTSHVVPTGIMGTPAVSEAGTAAPETASAATPAAETPAAAAASTPAAAGMPTTVTIESVDIDFIPAEVTVPANTDVTIDLPNHGQITHNFSITDHKNPDVPNLGISVNIQPGATEHVTVNAPPGDYYYYCNIPGHEAAGMWGTMHVVAQ